MRRHASRVRWVLLNIASVALVLPSCALALDFLAVNYLARHTLDEWLCSLWTGLGSLPSTEVVPLWSIGGLAAVIAVLCAVVWLPGVLPCLVLSAGIGSVGYIAWTVGLADIGTDPVIWLSLAGMVIAAWNIIRGA
jgi:hypothetical protein